MKKPVIVGGIILVILATGGGLFALNSKKSPVVSPLGLAPAPTAAPQLLTWEDPAGFKFAYPAAIRIDSHPEDKVNYANLDLGKIKILVADNAYKSLEDWAKKQQAVGGQVLDSTLADREAKKVIFTAPAKVMIATIDAEALVTLEADLGEGDYWATTFSNLLASFEFIPLASGPTKTSAKTGSAGTSSGGVIDEGEEIVE